MSETKRCPECGKELGGSAPSGLCPACLLKRGLETNSVAQATEGGAAAGRWMAPGVEEVAGRFPELEIARLIGRGGMGAVYEARQKNLDRVVALKILPPEMGGDAAFKERFAREAQAMARLNHPHIVAIYEFGEREGKGGGWYYFVMEFVDGVNLRGLLDSPPRGHVSPTEALAIVPQICEALQYAHDQGIVHRDIKPENILLNKRGQVKIADFGLAKLMGRGAAGGGMTEKVMGTPQYMAPEQMERPAEVDHRADIYSLGVVFYQMLTGELPVGRFEKPSRLVRVDVRLDEVVLRALEREPEKRYQQVSEVRTEVETIARTEAVGTAPAPPERVPVGSPLAGESRPRLSLLALVTALLLPLWFTPTPVWHLPAYLMPLPCVLGFLAVLRIRRSNGRAYGLALALIEILLLPCILLIGGFWTSFPSLNPQPAYALTGLSVVIFLPLLTYVAWRMVRALPPVHTPASAGEAIPAAPREKIRFAVAVAGSMILGILGYSALIHLWNGHGDASDHAGNNANILRPQGFLATLRSGITVELLGVSANPSDHSAWWKPDGSALAVRPYTHIGASVFPSGNEVAREFAVQLGRLPGGPIGTIWRFEPNGSSAGGGAPVEHSESIRNLRAVAVIAPALQPAMTVYFGVAAGPWKTVGETDGLGTETLSRGDGAVVFSPAVEKDGKTAITISYKLTDQEVRVVAVDAHGNEHLTGSMQNGGGGDLQQITATFMDLPLKEIRSFRFQARPYEWAVFKGVALNPSSSVATETTTMSTASVKVAGTEAQAALVGKWLERSNPRSLTFRSDGSFDLSTTGVRPQGAFDENSKKPAKKELLMGGRWEISKGQLKRTIEQCPDNPARIGEESIVDMQLIEPGLLKLSKPGGGPFWEYDSAEALQANPADATSINEPAPTDATLERWLEGKEIVQVGFQGPRVNPGKQMDWLTDKGASGFTETADAAGAPNSSFFVRLEVTPEHVKQMLALQKELAVLGYHRDAPRSKVWTYPADAPVRATARKMIPQVFAAAEKAAKEAVPRIQWKSRASDGPAPEAQVSGRPGIFDALTIVDITRDDSWQTEGENAQASVGDERSHLAHLGLMIRISFEREGDGEGNAPWKLTAENEAIRKAFRQAIEPLLKLEAELDATPAPAASNKAAPVETEAQAVAAIEKCGGIVTRDINAPDFPITWVTFQQGAKGKHGEVVTDEVLEHVVGFRQLRGLQIEDANVTDAGVEHLKGVSTLQVLGLKGTPVTDAGLEHLKGLKQLQKLDLRNTNVTDAGLENLKVLSKLDEAELDGFKVTEEGVKKLRDALPRCIVNHG